MTAVWYRLPEGSGHQTEISTVVMTAMKAEFFVKTEASMSENLFHNAVFAEVKF
jgi:hypothetical protein